MRARVAFDGLVIALAGLVPTVDAFFALSTGPIAGNECTVSYSADESTNGYQFEMFLAPNAPLTIGGEKPLTNFFPDFFVSERTAGSLCCPGSRNVGNSLAADVVVTVRVLLCSLSAGSGNTVQAFPFSDGTIPPTNGQVLPLVTIPLLGASDGVLPCLDNVSVGADSTGSRPVPV
eukprot:scaffold6270_cov215-Prasinococcus_capsulatus_cf.AAC.2